MSVVIKTAANRIFQEFRRDYMAELDQAPTLWRDYAAEVPVSGKSSLFMWLANQASVREWIGPRQHKNLSTRTWEVTHRTWELSYEFDARQIADDIEGVTASAVTAARNFGQKFARHEDSLVASVLEAGVSTNCWDGQYFFDTDHPVDIDGVTSGTWDNDLGLTLNHTNFNTAQVTMLGWKNPDGSPMLPVGGNWLLMVPPALKLQGQQVVEVPNLTAAASIGLFGTGGMNSNPFYGAARLVVNQYLTDTTRWYLLYSSGDMKPLLFLRKQALEVEEIGPGSELYYNERKIQIGGSARYDVTYGIPQLALTSKP